ncbi:cyclic peptide export ABC transporter [Fischerella thermalis]|uniref:cyclic peptide export ABC transporter n=1 Tax=Fischerella thermalis TaxID=372787 RepID=UPI001A0FEB8F|nr:cyclic peptide export ABC transporter [Fischerella thermalis]MBF1988267.1 cyclic peptide export ABC transporter [Fischerella thermalis M58_A2018_009]MBF2062537.1 cyclic peptide export ABC transporter [Fischerella thermalis M66_A2018_004]MBF2071562.1 cyclic peptide export ABC transporter [Fischerella thermalis M48_A2018_028]
MNLITLLLRSSWKIFILASFIGLLSGVSTAGLLITINTHINQVSLTTTLIVSFIGLWCLKFITNIISKYLLINLTEKAILELRLTLSERILATPLYHLEVLGKHRILATLTDDVLAISRTVYIIPTVCIDITIVASCLLYLFWLSPTIFLLVLISLLMGILSYLQLARKATSLFTLARQQEDRLFNHFQSITEGTKELKLHKERRQTFLKKELRETAQIYRRKNVVGMTIFAAAAGWGNSLFFIVVGLVIFALPTFQTIPTHVLSGYALTILYLLSPLDYIMSAIPAFSKATVALKKINSLKLSLSNHCHESNLMNWDEADNFCHRLEFAGITHTYHQDLEDTAFTLGPIDLTVSGGEIVFIVGGNGSGKSTLIKLITGLYTPESGKIYFNSKLVTAENQEWFRQHFSAVFSDFYLFDNLFNLGKNITDDKIKDYLVQLQLDKKVQINNGILSTTLLSQGQRKRLALLTAYLEDRPIYVFDEWASDQDPVFKKVFYSQILPELKNQGKTVIVVTHDDQYFYLSDRIVKLDYGKVENIYTCLMPSEQNLV